MTGVQTCALPISSYKIKGTVDGLQSILKSIDGLNKSLKNKLLRRALGEAGKLILKVAKTRAPRETGILKKSLGRKVKIYRQTGVGVAIVGPRTGFRQNVLRKKGKWAPTQAIANPTKYAHLQELGTVTRRAQPFLAPAIAGQQSAVRDAISAVITKGIDQQQSASK